MSAPTPWVLPPPKSQLVVGVADMVASNDPNAQLITYSLGSCLGVAVYDPGPKVGGLLHLMLPDSSIDPLKAAANPYMFVDTGVPRLFQALFNLGAERRRLLIRVAGGAQFLDPNGVFNIGERNSQALAQILARHGYRIHAQDLGGVSSRTLRLELASGQLTIRSPGLEPYCL